MPIWAKANDEWRRAMAVWVNDGGTWVRVSSGLSNAASLRGLTISPRLSALTAAAVPIAALQGLTVSPTVGDLTATLHGQFNPGDLGATLLTWLEADPDYLYQTTTGTAVTADTNPVGFVRDKAQELGPELVTNGDFSAGATGWTIPAGGNVSGGVLTFDGVTSYTANGVMAEQSLSFTVGKTYLVSFTVTGDTTLQVGPMLGGATGLSTASAGVLTSIIVPSSATGVLRILARFDTGARTGGIDNVSVREIPGIHATQATSSARPLYRTGAGLPYLQFDGSDDALVINKPASSINLYILLSTSDDKFMLGSAEDTSGQFFGAAEAMSLVPDASVGTPTYFVNGASVVRNRNTLLAACSTGQYLVAEVRGFTLAGGTQWRFAQWTGSGVFAFAGNVAAMVITDAATETTQDRDNIRSYLQGLIP